MWVAMCARVLVPSVRQCKCKFSYVRDELGALVVVVVARIETMFLMA